MLAVLLTQTLGHRNELIGYQYAEVHIAVRPIMDVKTHWNSTLEILGQANWLPEFTPKWLQNRQYSGQRPLVATQDEWTIVKYVMQVLRVFQEWTLWISKRHIISLDDSITVYNDMFDHMHGVMRGLAKKKTQLKESMFFTVKLAAQMMSKYYAEGTPMKRMFLISAHILDPFQMMRSFKKWVRGMDINPENETSYTTQYQETCLEYVENQYGAKHRQVLVTTLESVPSSNFVPSATASGSGQASWNLYDLRSDDEAYLTSNNVAETTPGQCNFAACLLTAACLYLNSLHQRPKNWGQINPNLIDYNSNQMKINSTLRILDFTN